MTKKEKSAKLISKYIQVFRCPLCKSPLKVVDLKSLLCSNNHTFDFAKQGYVNMLTRTANSPYDKKLFEARYKIIMESELYASLHKRIAEAINNHMDKAEDPLMILDAGCGEGCICKGS